MRNYLNLPKILKTFSVKRNRASVLSYAIVIALLNVFVVFAVIFKANYKSIELDRYKVNCQLHEIIRSVSIILEEFPQYFVEGYSNANFFKNELPNYNVQVSIKKWGLFFISKIDASYKSMNQSKMYLYADDVESFDELPSLYLSARKTYLSLSGNTYLGTNCYLPEYGVRSANFGGKNYTRTDYVFGQSYKANIELPALSPQLGKIIVEQGITNNELDSTIKKESFDRQRYFYNSFYNKTLVYYTLDSICLDNVEIRGNIKIISAKSILIKKNVILKDAIIIAPKIEVENEFSGCGQFFAESGIICGANCNFQIPTVFVLNNKSEDDKIDIGSGTRFYGNIIVQNNLQSRRISLKIDKDCKLIGQIYCNGYLSFEGVLFGSLYSRGFLKYTTSGMRLNVLEDVCIDVNRLPVEYSGVSLISSGNKKKLSDELF